MEDCAVNYLETANIDDGSCVYDFSGTYVINAYTINGVSAFSPAFGNPYVLESVVIFASDGTYETIEYLSDGTIEGDIGTYLNTLTTVGLYSDDPLIDDQIWNIININCLEFDGTSADANGNTYYAELDFVTNWTPTYGIISGCMDDCAVNYNEDATTGVGAVCLYDFLGTYSISNYKQDGISLFNADYWVDPLVAGAIYFGVTNSGVGVYESLYQYASGQQTGGTGTFTNNTTQLLLYPDEGGSQLWTTTKINCLEFDGESTVGGYFYEIELDFYSAKLDGSERNPNISKFDVTKFTKK